jgi:predicted metal-dependent HD superfamily phosphohydrolase
MDLFAHIQQHVLDKLRNGLPEKLTYHNIAHTQDVLQQAVEIAEKEGVKDPEHLLLLKASVLYHDTGFIYTYNGHEEKSCQIAAEELPAFGFTDAQIARVCSLIQATKVPQNPQSLLEKIICDADLDYLGRDDFFEIAGNLYTEFLDQCIVTCYREWNMLQIRFLENHTYFTQTSLERRQSKKLSYLQAIKVKEGLLH